jgi:hypothetical protein
MLPSGRRLRCCDLPVEGVGEGLCECAISSWSRHDGPSGYSYLTILIDERNWASRTRLGVGGRRLRRAIVKLRLKDGEVLEIVRPGNSRSSGDIFTLIVIGSMTQISRDPL